ncbi:Fkbp-type peptidyl-prolyl cis-trans isomerase, partial [Globisporangium splendens]
MPAAFASSTSRARQPHDWKARSLAGLQIANGNTGAERLDPPIAVVPRNQPLHGAVESDDGRKFDSSRDREKPFKFKLGAEQVIPGLDEGVERLCMKERAKISIPADKA